MTKPIAGGLNLITIANGNSQKLRYIIEQKDNVAHLIVEVSAPVRGEPYTIIKRPKSQPSLFTDFPLIGSHNFAFPCIINSHLFWPNEERSSVNLVQSSRSKINREIVERSVLLLQKMIRVASNQKWGGIGTLLNIKLPGLVDENWY